MKRLVFTVSLDKRGRPLWTTLQVRESRMPKAKRIFKKPMRKITGVDLSKGGNHKLLVTPHV